MEKSRITVRFDPSGKAAAPVKETAPPKPRHERSGKIIPIRPDEYAALDEPDPDYPYDYGAWKHSAAREADVLERLIRQSEPVPGPLPDDGDLRAETGVWDDPGPRRPRRRPPRAADFGRGADEAFPPLWKMAAAVLGAVATGLLFGTLLMNLIAGEPPAPEFSLQATERPENGTPAPAAGPAAGEGEAAELSGDTAQESAVPGAAGSALTAPAEVEIPARRMWLLQYGIFRTLDNARAMAQSVREKGFAATIEEADGFYVYAGIASDRDAALRTGARLTAEGFEVYVKPYALPSVTQVRWEDGSADALADYLAKGAGLLRLIGDLTLVHLEGEPVAPEESTLEMLRRSIGIFSPCIRRFIPACPRTRSRAWREWTSPPAMR